MRGYDEARGRGRRQARVGEWTRRDRGGQQGCVHGCRGPGLGKSQTMMTAVTGTQGGFGCVD